MRIQCANHLHFLVVLAIHFEHLHSAGARGVKAEALPKQAVGAFEAKHLTRTCRCCRVAAATKRQCRCRRIC